MEFDIRKFEHRLKTLPKIKQLVYGAMVCERLYPNYVDFEREQKWGKSTILRQALDAAWHSFVEGRHDANLIRHLIPQCDSAVPQVEEFASNSVSMAVDACTAIANLLESMTGGSTQQIAEICSLAVDSVDRYIQFQELADKSAISASEEQYISQHPLMQAELKRQEQQLRSVEAAYQMDHTTIGSFKEASQKERLF